MFMRACGSSQAHDIILGRVAYLRAFLEVIPSHSMFHRSLLDMLDPFPSFCSTPLNSLLLTGIRRNSCATPPGGMLSGHLAESSPHTGYEAKTCIDLSIEHTPIHYPSRRSSFNIEDELTTTVASSENSDGFHQQAAVSGSPQPVPASVVNPWLSADMWSSTRKPVRGNASIASVEGTLSRGKRESRFGKCANSA